MLAVRAATGRARRRAGGRRRGGGDVAPPDTAVVDLYLLVPSDDAPDRRRVADPARGRCSTPPTLPPAIRRVAVIAVHPDRAVATQVFTFRRADADGEAPYWMPGAAAADRSAALRRGRKFRGLHPMIARRLQMWRLSNFEIIRLPSVDEVYAYDCVARDNPADRRLVAVAEIRGMTPVRDDSGRAVAMPEVEMALTGCLDAIRSARAGDPDGARSSGTA